MDDNTNEELTTPQEEPTETSTDTPSTPENLDNTEESINNVENNASRPVALNGREAFANRLRGNNDNQLEESLRKAQEEKFNQTKMKNGHEGEEKHADANTGEANFEDKNKIDKAKDSLNVLKAKNDVLTNNINKSKAALFAITNPVEAAEMAVKFHIRGLIIAAIGTILPFIVIFIVVIIVALGIINNEGSSTSQNYCSAISDTETSVIFDNSFTKEQFLSLVNSYNVPDATHNGHKYSWGYETFFKPNASNFYDICTKHGIDPRFIFSIGLHESAFGTSNIALKKGNFFGWGAYDSSPYDSALTFHDMSDGIEAVAGGLSRSYVTEGGSQYKAIKARGLDPRTVQGIGSSYASDPNWPSSVVGYMQKVFGVTKTSSNCNGSFNPLTEYNYNHHGLVALDSKLSNIQINTINSRIITEVDKAGYGTGAAVAAAGQSLVYGLQLEGVYLRYHYGAKNLSIGVNPIWQKYDTMDCSGFVSWAIKNGCNASYAGTGTSSFSNYGTRISLEETKPGDIMVTYGKGHIRLIVKNNGDGTVVTAEETSSKGGLVFTLRDGKERRPYQFRDMSGWYASNCKKSR